MKTKQQNLKAVFTSSESNAINMHREKETVSRYLVIDKKTERHIVDCRVYMGRSASSSTAYASIWIYGDNVPSNYTSGKGQAGGYGYHKESAAIEAALRSAGVELYGTAYTNTYGGKVDFKKQAYIGGVGGDAIKSALLAVAYAAGCKDAVFVGA